MPEPRVRRDHTRGVDAADASDSLGDEHVTARRNGDGDRPVQLRSGRRAAVARVSVDARAGERRDRPARGVDPADAMRTDDVDVAVRRDRSVDREPDGGRGRLDPVGLEAVTSVSGDHLEATAAEPEHVVRAAVRDHERAVRRDRDAERLEEVGAGRPHVDGRERHRARAETGGEAPVAGQRHAELRPVDAPGASRDRRGRSVRGGREDRQPGVRPAYADRDRERRAGLRLPRRGEERDGGPRRIDRGGFPATRGRAA